MIGDVSLCASSQWYTVFSNGDIVDMYEWRFKVKFVFIGETMGDKASGLDEETGEPASSCTRGEHGVEVRCEEPISRESSRSAVVRLS